MKRLNYLIIAGISIAALTAGCVQKPANNEAEEATASVQAEEASQTRVVRERQAERSQPAPTATETQRPSLTDPARQLPRLQGELDSDGYGLNMIIDGSSPDAFLQSLEIIASDSSRQQFQTFQSSLQYLQAYSMDGGNLATFYQTLDGRTAEEVIEMAANRRVRRSR